MYAYVYTFITEFIQRFELFHMAYSYFKEKRLVNKYVLLLNIPLY